MKKILRVIVRSLLILFLLLNVIVIFHAYKFTHFYNAGELGLMPGAKKSGWDNTKSILFGFDAEKQVNIAPDTAFNKVILTTKDSTKLEGWSIPVRHPRGTVILFHGHGGKKSGVLEEAYQFNKLGFSTFLLDFRAHGNSGGNTCTIGYTESEDVKLTYDFVKSRGDSNIILWGISMGGATVTKAVHDFHLAPSKIILEMPFGSLPDAVAGRIRMMHLPAEPLSTLLTFWGGTIHGFWAYGMKPSEYAKDINCPVLLQWGRHDPRVSEKETQDIYSNLRVQKKLVVYEESGHESLYKKEPAKWIKEVSEFLQ
jgi:alpha-beta hydrolase superfamily lysophospholipase